MLIEEVKAGGFSFVLCYVVFWSTLVFDFSVERKTWSKA